MINTKHKDRLFAFLFGREENKRWTLSLYNAVNGSSYTDSGIIQITTMDDVLYMGMKNDVSFLIANSMSIYEQQSTYNPNMPVRELMYAARLYDKYIHENKLNIYGKERIPLPTPKLAVFYNGRENQEDRVLELKDAFWADAEEADISVRVRMMNINYGKNGELLKACKPLGEYAWLIQRIREYGERMEIEEAVDHAIDEMPEAFEIREYLVGNRAEVKQMCITEYNEAETMEMFREEGRREGRQEGRREGRQEGRREGIGIGEQSKANEIAKSMIEAHEPGEKIVLYTGLGKEEVDRLAGALHVVLMWK